MDVQSSAVIPDAPKARSGTHFSLDQSNDGGDIWIPALAALGRDDSGVG